MKFNDYATGGECAILSYCKTLSLFEESSVLFSGPKNKLR